MMLLRPRIRPAHAATQLFLFALGMAVNLHYGFRAFDESDSPVFDGGWRVLHGQLPMVDYLQAFSHVPDIMQAGFFALFGVNVTAYVLHAAVINGIFCILAFDLLRRLGASFWLALLFAALSSLTLYPPRGFAFIDTHSFFFGFCAVWMMVRAAGAAPGWSAIRSHAFVFAFLALSFLSKPSPAVFFLPLILALAVLQGARWRELAIGAALSGFVTIVVVGVAMATSFASVSENLYYMFGLPREIASQRFHWNNPVTWLGMVVMTPRPLTALGPVCFMGMFLGLGLMVEAVVRLRGRKQVLADQGFQIGFLAFSLDFLSSAFIQVSSNLWESNTPFAFVSLGMGLASLLRNDRRGSNSVILAVALSLFAVERADCYRQKVVASRYAYSQFTTTDVPPQPVDFPGLEHLRWMQKRCTAAQAAAQLRAVAALPGNFVGTTCLGGANWGWANALVGRPSIMPARGHYPHEGSAHRPAYEAMVLRKLTENDIRFVIVGNNGLVADEMVQFIAGRPQCGRRKVAGLDIVELCPGAWGGGAR